MSAVVLGGVVVVAPEAVAAGVSGSAHVYTRAFYKNTSFSGSPVKTDCDSAVDQSWSGRPLSGMPADNFGVRCR